ncbi:hypothetical protein M427DRAFT_60087 [Gonapodya prolifera JEL478]|uniref:Uncharacterized protein n=1 Tax=Gonapodya prolifera (strain JEL478) TaxID=1344416 RepID=A0A139A563_GONPJ|nr:hypothetical protein M427DRAFT_60087 [Gonapodya prolifera JEL478]|eukprot:KXS11946.1 hypothetical protein M427DRAFT_60087 [Gonapodya prolifera JEL478]
MRLLYNQFLGYLSFQRSLGHQLGALFGLYLLYFTQPDEMPIQRIKLNQSIWGTMQQLIAFCKSQGLLEPVFLFHKMLRSGCFLHIAGTE